MTVVCFSQEKHAQTQQIKHEIEALKRKVCSILIDRQTDKHKVKQLDLRSISRFQDRLESVARIRRKDAFAVAAQRRRMNQIQDKISEFEQHKVQEYLDKMRYKQDMHLQEEVVWILFKTRIRCC